MFLPLLACATGEPAAAPTATLVAPPSEPAPAGPHGHGGTVYVPVYSSVYVGEARQTFDLTVTLSVRNTDAVHPIVVHAVDYHDPTGARVHAYVEAPTPLGPLASAETVVRASDRRAGIGGSFLVTWSAAEPVSEPVVQGVMIGTAAQQGISFVTEGRVLETLPAPSR